MQLLALDHRSWVSMMIRQNIDRYDWVVSNQVPDERKAVKRTIRGRYGDVSLGSPRKPWSFACLEDNNSADPAFFKFRIALQNYLPTYSEAVASKLHGRPVRFQPDDKVCLPSYATIKTISDPRRRPLLHTAT